MRISTKGRYALRVLLDLAEHMDDGFIPLKDIADRQNISKNYLEQIMPLLGKNNYLKTSRGYMGGYQLAKPPSAYTVGDILRITESGFVPVACLEDGASCPQSTACRARNVWKGLEKAIFDYLDNITLQDIMEQPLNPEDLIYNI